MVERKSVFKPSAGPSIEEYIRPELPPIAHLESIIAKSPFLSELSQSNRAESLVYAFYRYSVNSLVKEKQHIAYYPGIGGGNEPIDVLSAFCVLDVNEVVGVDVQTSRNADWDRNGYRVDQALEKIIEQDKFKIEVLNVSENYGEFLFDGERRIINSYKGDAFKFIPQEEFQIIYQRREASLIPFLPRDVINKSKLIFCSDDNTFMPLRVADFALMHGFMPINLGFVSKFLGNGNNNLNNWEGNPQLAIRHNY